MLLKCYLELNEVDKAESSLNRLVESFPDDMNVLLASYTILKKTTQDPNKLYDRSLELLDSVLNRKDLKNLDRIGYMVIDNAEKIVNSENVTEITKQVCRILEASEDKDIAKRVYGYFQKLQSNNIIGNQEMLNFLRKYETKIEVDKNLIDSLEEDNIKQQESLMSKLNSEGRLHSLFIKK